MNTKCPAANTPTSASRPTPWASATAGAKSPAPTPRSTSSSATSSRSRRPPRSSATCACSSSPAASRRRMCQNSNPAALISPRVSSTCYPAASGNPTAAGRRTSRKSCSATKRPPPSAPANLRIQWIWLPHVRSSPPSSAAPPAMTTSTHT